AVYFAGVMVRLMLTLTPCVCVLAAIAFSHSFKLYLVEEETVIQGSLTGSPDKAGEKRKSKLVKKREGGDTATAPATATAGSGASFAGTT
ncbi:hypothetical protein, partial [Enterococcus faecalis]|uniref:hypothetical protein n=1 Tax=Enterococcus faecalis TaxID=1351 RepID=UPI0022F0B034